MKIISNIIISIIVIPFAIVGGLFFALIKFLWLPIELTFAILCDIWESD